MELLGAERWGKGVHDEAGTHKRVIVSLVCYLVCYQLSHNILSLMICTIIADGKLSDWREIARNY